MIPKTEMRNPKSTHIDQMSTIEMVKLMSEENYVAVKAVEDACDDIAKAVDAISASMEQGGRLYYIGGKPAGEILTPGQYIHGHMNFGTTYRTLTYLCTDHADTVQQLYNQIPNQTPLQLWGNPNMTPWKTPTGQGGNGNEVPHPVYEPHNIMSDIAGAPPSWGTFSVELLFKYEADDYTGKMDPLCSNGDNYIIYCPTGDHQRNVRCFGFYGSKDPFPMLNY